MTSENPSTQGDRDYSFSSSLSGDEKSKVQMTEELTRVVPGHGGLGIFSTSLRMKGDYGKVLLAIRQLKVGSKSCLFLLLDLSRPFSMLSDWTHLGVPAPKPERFVKEGGSSASSLSSSGELGCEECDDRGHVLMELETNLGNMPQGQVVAAHWSISKPMKNINHEEQKSGAI